MASPTARGSRSSLQLRFLVEHVLARLGVVLLDLHLVGHRALVLGRGVEVAGAGRRFELDLLAHGSAPQTFSPRARMSASTKSMPFLSMRRRPALVRRIFT